MNAFDVRWLADGEKPPQDSAERVAMPRDEFCRDDSIGDALHAVLCAACYNMRWLLRMIAKKGLRLLLCLWQAAGWRQFGKN